MDEKFWKSLFQAITDLAVVVICPFTFLKQNKRWRCRELRLRKSIFAIMATLIISSVSFILPDLAFSEPSNWPAPWDKNVTLTMGYNPRTGHPTGTWLESGGKPEWQTQYPAGKKYAFDFLPNGYDNIRIYSPVDGTILRRRNDSVYGNYIIIRGDGQDILMAHLREFDSDLGETGGTVSVGTPIGIMGRTGTGANATVHLHFELIGHLIEENITIFGINKNDFDNGREVQGRIDNQFGGDYRAINGYHENNNTSSPMSNGGLTIIGSCVSDGRDMLSLKTYGTNGRINFLNGGWLSFGGKDTVFPKKSIGSSSEQTLWEWETVNPDHLHYSSASVFPIRVSARYILTQVDAVTLKLRIEHKYSKIEIILKKNYSATSSLKVFGATASDASIQNKDANNSGGASSFLD